ncbi:HAD-IA family hydrolase [Kiloniella laminariae]|uniref:HAD-IA family hydrolase n=1 Tax=Kiloniella laminariae TaxID=454162 RepID=UPI0012FC52FC|nr:HAD-IA family hydrolase [Kiloniella laminariae]
MSKLNRVLRQADIKVISVDVFDTLLLRTTRPELQRFRDFVQKQHAFFLLEDFFSVEELYQSRLRAGKVLYDRIKNTDGNVEVTYQDICLQMQTELPLLKQLQNDWWRNFLAIELAQELTGLTPRKDLWDLLKHYENKGKTVIFSSDMYLNTSSLGFLLEKLFDEGGDTEIYVSSDLQKTKRQGTLYRLLLEKFQIEPRQMIHIGDNFVSDIFIPKAMGIQTYYLPRSLLWRLLQSIRKKNYANSLRRKG